MTFLKKTATATPATPRKHPPPQQNDDDDDTN